MFSNVAAIRLTLYAFISSIEMDIRIFFISNINEENEKLLIDDELITRLKFRSSKDGYFIDDSTHLIEYLDFSDCISLLNKYKRLMPKSMHLSIETLTKELLKIVPIRNRVMHSRPLEYEDFPTITDFIDLVNKIELIDWSSTQDIKEKIRKDPSIIFGINIPLIENYTNDKVLHNLPPAEFDDTGFVGRELDRRAIKNKINGNFPVISIIGDGGIGKTALLLRCMYDIVDDPKQMFDAIIWVSLKTRILNNGEFRNIQNSITSVLEMFKVISMKLVGDQIIQEDTIENHVNEILEYMNNFKILLVLDNLETINSETIRDFLGRIPSGSKIVTTSRIGLGEFEARHVLEGFNDKDGLYYLRRLAQNFQLTDILKLTESNQIDICKKLYSNPLAIKWFLLNLLKGEPMEKILLHKEDLTNFCMSNVYDKLSDVNKKVLETMQITSKKCTDAELEYLLELESISHRKALNELVSTNMVKMESYSENNKLMSYFYITEFAREYLNQHCKPTNASFIKIDKKIKQLKGMAENLSTEVEIDQYDVKSIIAENENEKIAAYYLRQALVFSSQQDFSNAFAQITKAKNAVPDYYEIYKISAYIYGANRDFYNANNEYKTAIDIKMDSAPLWFSYSEFKLSLMDDPEEAFELTLKAEKLDDVSFEIKLQKARILKRLKNFKEADEIFDNIIENLDNLKNKIRRITIDQSADNFKRWGEKYVLQENFPEAIAMFEKAIMRISILEENDQDHQIIITISKILKATQYTCVFLGMEYQAGVNLYISILKEYGPKIIKSPKYDEIKIGIKSLYRHFSPNTINILDQYLIEDIKALAKKVASETEGYIHSKNKGFGFIINRIHKSGLFFHWSELKGNFSELLEGEKVSFVLDSNDRGLIAKEVQLIEEFS